MRKQNALRAWVRKCILQRSASFAVIAAIVLIGVLVGAVSAHRIDSPGKQELSSYGRDLLQSIATQGGSPRKTWSLTLIDHVVKTAGLVWLLGLSVIGVPLIAAVVFLRGFSLGFTLGFLLQDLLLRGALLSVVALLPQHLFLIPGLVCVSVGAMTFSLAALRILLGRPVARDIYHHLQTDGSLALVGCLLLCVGGLLESFVTPGLTAVATRFLLRGV